MDAEPGGESSQYESIQTVTKPTPKDGGQLGEPETEQITSQPVSSAEASQRGARTADNIRYGQNISESGQGGMTTTSSGAAATGSGYGSVRDESESSADGPAEQRSKAGYGSGQDVGNDVGA